MNLREIAERLGIVLVGHRYHWSSDITIAFPKMGSPPQSEDAFLCEPGDRVVYRMPFRCTINAADALLHEICHAVAGPLALQECEIGSGLMALQWALLRELRDRPQIYRAGRKGLATYSLDGWDEIGETDEFLDTREWRRTTKAAIENGFLTRDGRLDWKQRSRFASR